MTFIIIGLLAVTAYLTFYFSTDRLMQFGKSFSGERPERVKTSPYFNGDIFVNTATVEMSFTFSEYVTMFKNFFFGKDRSPGIDIPVMKLNDHSTELTGIFFSSRLPSLTGYSKFAEVIKKTKIINSI